MGRTLKDPDLVRAHSAPDSRPDLTNGVPLHVVAARLGDRPETMLRTYAHLLPQSDVEAAEQVAALIAS